MFLFTIRRAALERLFTHFPCSVLTKHFRNLSGSSAYLAIASVSRNKRPLFPDASKQSKLMKKVIAKQSQNLKMKKNDPDTFDVDSVLTGGKHMRRPYFINKHRAKRLNSLFMDIISDILSTGSASYNLHDYDIEITKVELTKLSDAVNVYWWCSDPSQVEVVKEILKSIAPRLRQEVLELQIVGYLPYINFVEDTNKMTNQIFEKLFKETQIDIRRLEADSGVVSSETYSDQVTQDVASMKTSVYGVNHNKLMDLVKQKSKNKIREKRGSSSEGKNVTQEQVFDVLDNKKFENFLIDRRRKQLKTKTQTSNHNEIHENFLSDDESMSGSDQEDDKFHDSDNE